MRVNINKDDIADSHSDNQHIVRILPYIWLCVIYFSVVLFED